jgi:hypothetical protein
MSSDSCSIRGLAAAAKQTRPVSAITATEARPCAERRWGRH